MLTKSPPYKQGYMDCVAQLADARVEIERLRVVLGEISDYAEKLNDYGRTEHLWYVGTVGKALGRPASKPKPFG